MGMDPSAVDWGMVWDPRIDVANAFNLSVVDGSSRPSRGPGTMLRSETGEARVRVTLGLSVRVFQDGRGEEAPQSRALMTLAGLLCA